MINKYTICEYLHSACLAKFIYSINKNLPYDKKDTFINNIKNLIKFNGKTYKILEELFPGDKFIKYISCSKTGLDSLITVNEIEKKIYVTFRGTEMKTIDTYYNLIFVKKYLINDIFVHKGYWDHLTKNKLHLTMCEIIIKLLDKYPNFNINVSGHSLAAQLSVLFTYILIEKVPSLNNKINVNMFAPPAACNKNMFTFLKSKNIKISSFIYKNDFITSLFFGYYEYFPRYVLSDNYYYYLTNKNDGTLDSHKKDFGINYIKDHECKNYLNSLLTIYKKYY
jgi:hypothetical protein